MAVFRRMTALVSALAVLTMIAMVPIAVGAIAGTEDFAFESGVGDVSCAGEDFECRLLVGFDGEPQVREGDAVLDIQRNIALIGIGSEGALQDALTYYGAIAAFAAPDEELAIAEGAVGEAPAAPSATAAISVKSLESLEEPVMQVASSAPLVALVDTGVSEGANVVARTSVLGAFSEDDNGHGDDMLGTMLAENPAAQVLSVKALDAQGIGTVASAYAGIMYAIDAGADIINLSFSALAPSGNAAIEHAVRLAEMSGIRVVASAGNANADASQYIPAACAAATTTGACDAQGAKQPASNFGACIDVWIEAASTSEAAARASGWLSLTSADADLTECPFARRELASNDDEDAENGKREEGLGDEAPDLDMLKDIPGYGLPVDYTIVFDANGGSGSMQNQEIRVVMGRYSNAVLRKNEYKRDGFVFDGWQAVVPDKTASDPEETHVGTVVVPDAQKFVNLCWETDEFDHKGFAGVVSLASYANTETNQIVLKARWRNESSNEVDTGVVDDSARFSIDTSSTSYTAIRGYNIGNATYLAASLSGWSCYADPLFYAPNSSSTPVYRAYNKYATNTYLWTISSSEYNQLIQAGWTGQGVAFYADDAHGVTVYRFFNSSVGHHWYQLSSTKSGWTCETSNTLFGLKWYNVAFNGNNATSGSMTNQRYQYGISYNLPANEFSRTGYSFNGWSGSNGGNYSNSQSVSNLTATSNGTVTLSAKWAAHTYTVAFDANGGSGTVASQKMTYGSSAALTANAFTRPGYAFSGWNTQESGSGTSYSDAQQVSNLTADNDVTVTLYAQWTPIQLRFSVPSSIELSLRADGTLESPNASRQFFQSETDALIRVKEARVLSKGDLQFVRDSPGADEVKLRLGPTEPACIELADFDGSEYKTIANLPQWRIGSFSTLPINAVSGSCGSLLSDDSLGGEFASVDWKVSLYTVTVRYKANGAIGTMESQQVSAGHAFKLPACSFSNAGKTFAGWNTKANGSGDSYASGQAVSFSDDVTLYAQWN